MPDQTRECVSCHQAFVWTEGEQEFFKKMEFKNPPKRCRACRPDHRGRFSNPIKVDKNDFGRIWRDVRSRSR